MFQFLCREEWELIAFHGYFESREFVSYLYKSCEGKVVIDYRDIEVVVNGLLLFQFHLFSLQPLCHIKSYHLTSD